MESISEFVTSKVKSNKEDLIAILDKDEEIPVPVFIPKSLTKYIRIENKEKVELIGYRSGGRNIYLPNDSLEEVGIKLPFYSVYGIEIKGAGSKIKDAPPPFYDKEVLKEVINQYLRKKRQRLNY